MSTIPYQDVILVAIFALVVGVTIGGALIAALSTRIIRGVSGLMLCCMGLGGLYYFLNSPFLALMEILIYVGAVCVTIVFGVMLSEPDEPPHEETRRHAMLWGGAALLVSLVILGGVAHLGLRGPWQEPAARVSDGSVQAIGLALLTTYSLPFELISIVLLVAILGALVIARSGRTKE
jgi:NADH:ubiquinone oxidoreductase subunit 6 (subunit J)